MKTLFKVIIVLALILFAAYTFVWFDIASKTKQQMRDVSEFKNLDKVVGDLDGINPAMFGMAKNFINFDLGDMKVTGYPLAFNFEVDGFKVTPAATALLAAASFVPPELGGVINDIKVEYPRSVTSYGIFNRNATSYTDGTVNILGLEFNSSEPTKIESKGCSGFIDLVKQHYFDVKQDDCMKEQGISGFEYASRGSSTSYGGNNYFTTEKTDINVDGLFSSNEVEVQYSVENYKIYSELFSDILALINTVEGLPMLAQQGEKAPDEVKNILNLLAKTTDNSTRGTDIIFDVDLEFNEPLDLDSKREPKLQEFEIESIRFANSKYSINLQGEAEVRQEAFNFKLEIENIDSVFKAVESVKDYYVSISQKMGKNIDEDLAKYEFVKNTIIPTIRSLAKREGDKYIYNISKAPNEDMPKINDLSFDKFFEAAQ